MIEGSLLILLLLTNDKNQLTQVSGEEVRAFRISSFGDRMLYAFDKYYYQKH